MAAVLGDLLEFSVRQTLYGQDVYNMFYYRVTSVTGFTNDGYEALENEFRDQVLATQATLQSADLQYREITLKNLSNGIDFYTETIAVDDMTGTLELAALPSYVCYTFRLLRESLATRNGYKRVAGVPEAWVTGNDFSASVTPLNNYAVELAADLIIGIATIAEPIIVRRPIVVPMGTSYVYASVGSAEYRKISTQNTRKPGSGS